MVIPAGITGPISALWASMTDKILLFNGYLSERYLQGGFPGQSVIEEGDIRRERMDILAEWMQDPTEEPAIPSVFTRRWTYHRLPRAEAKDWPTPLNFLPLYLRGLALPQEPQKRVVLNCQGAKRTIRVKD